MHKHAIATLLGDLRATDYGWHAEIPPAIATLSGLPIGIEIHTRLVPQPDQPPPPVSSVETDLARLILSSLDEIVADVHRRLVDYVSDYEPAALERVMHPHVWISRETLQGTGASRWAFVIGARDNPDFGYHVEFRGVESLEIWAGD